MWWKKLQEMAISSERSHGVSGTIAPSAIVHEKADIDPRVTIGENTRICRYACIEGDVEIGSDCLIGNHVFIRGPVRIGNGVLLGLMTEVKNSIIGDGVAIGPQCFVSDSVVDDHAYLGAQVRTSNHRLDKALVKVVIDGVSHDTGLEKLGCHIGARTSLGIQCIIFPGRIVPAESMFGPRINIERNYKSGIYQLRQTIEMKE